MGPQFSVLLKAILLPSLEIRLYQAPHLMSAQHPFAPSLQFSTKPRRTPTSELIFFFPCLFFPPMVGDGEVKPDYGAMLLSALNQAQPGWLITGKRAYWYPAEGELPDTLSLSLLLSRTILAASLALCVDDALHKYAASPGQTNKSSLLLGRIDKVDDGVF